MDETHLYQKIAETLRQKIIRGEIKPGDRLPSVRDMALEWDCTPGTIQRAYHELTKQGLIISRAGQGTKVVQQSPATPLSDQPLRYAALVHRAEAFLLEMITAGFELPEIEDGLRQAMDRWRSVNPLPARSIENQIRFAGSHDLVITWLASHFLDITGKYELDLRFIGSLGGLIALAEGNADLAGAHLWDHTNDTFNSPFISRILPGKRVCLITVAYRRLGLIFPLGNPHNIQRLEDLAGGKLRFINRQPGSGTRVWLDETLKKSSIPTDSIIGYGNEKTTHSAVARAVAESEGDVGIGLEAAARSYGLGFTFLRNDRYDLVIPEATMQHPAVIALIDWLKLSKTKEFITGLGGYDTELTGRFEWVE